MVLIHSKCIFVHPYDYEITNYDSSIIQCIMVAVGTLNSSISSKFRHLLIFLPFTSPNFIAVFLSWIDLEIGFDICIYDGTDYLTKGAIQLVFSLSTLSYNDSGQPMFFYVCQDNQPIG